MGLLTPHLAVAAVYIKVPRPDCQRAPDCITSARSSSFKHKAKVSKGNARSCQRYKKDARMSDLLNANNQAGSKGQVSKLLSC